MINKYSRRSVSLLSLFTGIALAAVLVCSIGFYGLKGGIFTLMHGGNLRVWGPGGSFIEGNNELALAIIVCIPLMRLMSRPSSCSSKPRVQRPPPDRHLARRCPDPFRAPASRRGADYPPQPIVVQRAGWEKALTPCQSQR